MSTNRTATPLLHGPLASGIILPAVRQRLATATSSGYLAKNSEANYRSGAVESKNFNWVTQAGLVPVVYDGTYINGTVTTGVALTGTPQNPVTITGSGFVTNTTRVHGGDAIHGSTAAAWTISNLGTIEGNPALALANGIRLAAGGFITNGQSGSAYGLVSGSAVGVLIEGTTGTISNFGTIRGTDLGVDLAAAGTISNFGLIQSTASGGSGIDLASGGNIGNYGTIEGTGSYSRGLVTPGVIYVRNEAGGLISGVLQGALISHGSVGNAGTIRATDPNGRGAGLILVDGSVTNMADALIEGTSFGIQLYDGEVSNAGTIRSTGSSGFHSRGVYVYSGGDVSNAAGGLIQGFSDGIMMRGTIASTVNNYGTITAFYNGIWMACQGGVVANFSTIAGTDSGIYMNVGGLVINGASGAASALITSASYGIKLGSGVPTTVSNFGTIEARGTRGLGVFLHGSGNVTNQMGALISGMYAVQISNPFVPTLASTVANFGTIASLAASGIGIDLVIGAVGNYGLIQAGTGGFGVRMTGGTVVNAGTIAAALNGYGVSVYGNNNGTVINFGTIVAAGPQGQAVAARGGTFINYGFVQGSVSGIVMSPGASGAGNVTVSGTVVGATGISATSPAGTSQTLTVAGSVTGTSGTAVSLTPGGSDRLILEPGALFQGTIYGGGGNSVLQVSAASAALRAGWPALVAYVGLGNIVNFSTLQIDPSAVADASGVLSFDTLVNEGQIIVASGDAVSFGTVLGAAATGIVRLRSGGVVHFRGAVGNQTIDFDPAGGRAVIDHPEAFGAAIVGFEEGDTIDLALAAAADPHYAGGVLTLSYGGVVVALSVLTPYTRPVFVLSADPLGGTDITVRPYIPPRDFNGSGTSDVLWRDTAGNVAIWLQQGTTTLSSTVVGFADASWTINGTGDFDGDGVADLLWRNVDGNVAIWTMIGATVGGTAIAGFADPAAWTIATTGDFGGDGRSDILWREASGNVAVWEMSGTTVVSSTVLGFADPSWRIAGAGDFDADGSSDIFWQSPSGDVAVWRLNGASVASSVGIGFADPAFWRLRGTGDFDGNGRADLLWHSTAGDVVVWLSDGATISATAIVGFADSAFWSIRGIGDYNGDGMSDILWRDTGGNVVVWELNGATVTATGAVGFADPATWSIVPPDNTGTIQAAGAVVHTSDAAFSFADVSADRDSGAATETADAGPAPHSAAGLSGPSPSLSTPAAYSILSL